MWVCPQYGFRRLLKGLAKTQSPAVLYFVCSRHVRRVLARTGSSGTGFCDTSHLQEPTTCITIERVTLISFLLKLMSVHLSPNSSLALSPVTTSSRTMVDRKSVV